VSHSLLPLGQIYAERKDIPRLPSGQENYYRVCQVQGIGGSRKEATWDRPNHTHTCCGSRVPWRHKVSCKNLSDGTLPPDE
jgi:hypothetical protein